MLPLHGIGGAKDLPIPLALAVARRDRRAGHLVLRAGAGLAHAAPPAPRPGRPAPRQFERVVDGPRFQWTLRILGLLFFAYLTWALVWGPDLVTNPVLGTFYVLVWVGIVPSSLLFGPVVRAVSPVRTINLLLARVTGGDPADGPDRPTRPGSATGRRRSGCSRSSGRSWSTRRAPTSARCGSGWRRTSRSCWSAPPSSVTCGSSGPTRSRSTPTCWPSCPPGAATARPARRAQPAGEPRHRRPRPGLVAVVAVLFGSTAFDTYKDTLPWQRFVSDVGLDDTFTNTVALLVFCLVVGGTFTAAAMSTGVDTTGPDAVRRTRRCRACSPTRWCRSSSAT